MAEERRSVFSSGKMGNCCGKDQGEDDGQAEAHNKPGLGVRQSRGFPGQGSAGQRPAAFRRASSTKDQASQTEKAMSIPKPTAFHVMDEKQTAGAESATSPGDEEPGVNPDTAGGDEQQGTAVGDEAAPKENLQNYRQHRRENPEWAPYMQETYIPTAAPHSPNDAEPEKDVGAYKKEILENKVYAPYLDPGTNQDEESAGTATAATPDAPQDGTTAKPVDPHSQESKLNAYKSKLQSTSFNQGKRNTSSRNLNGVKPQQLYTVTSPSRHGESVLDCQGVLARHPTAQIRGRNSQNFCKADLANLDCVNNLC